MFYLCFTLQICIIVNSNGYFPITIYDDIVIDNNNNNDDDNNKSMGIKKL